MLKIQFTVNLTDDEYTGEGEEIQVQIEESLPDGLKDLDQWEADVRKMGFQAMRKIYRCGIELYEKKLLSEYTHKGKQCQTQNRGKRDLTLATVFGKVTFPRQRVHCSVHCKTCKQWMIPLNEALGLHEEDKERTTLAL